MTKTIKVISLGLVVMAAAVFGAGVARAESVSSFHSEIKLQSSGRVDVTETILYDFGYVDRHGIYRYIPEKYQDDAGNSYRPNIVFDSATIDGYSTPASLSHKDDNLVIRLGDANRTISGNHTYVVAYHFDTVLINKGGDLLRLDVTGDGWQVPLSQVSATITGPAVPKLACYTGAAGSTAHDCNIAGNTAVTTSVASGQNFTIEALWPTGTVTNLLQPYHMPGWQVALLIAAFVYVAAGLLILLAAAIRWLGIRWAERRARKDQTIVAQYQPPQDLTPGELGLLADNKVSLVEVTATLIQSAVKKVVRIELVSEASAFKKANYKLVKVGDVNSLPSDERPLINALFGGAQSVELSEVDRTTVPAAVTAYQNALRASLKAKQLYTPASKFATAVTWVGLAFAGIAFFTPLAFLAAIFILPLGLFAYYRAGQSPRLTPAGLQQWAYVQGFKLFLSVTEKDRLEFTDAPKRTPEQFSEFLPYAIALGVEQEWAKQFEGIDVASSLDWYNGHGQAFTAAYIASSMHDSFSPAVTSASASPSSTGSGGFGGGFSGGGFGGGGGGSW